MPFDHNFLYSFSFFSSLFFRREDKRGKECTKSWSKVVPFCSIFLKKVILFTYDFFPFSKNSFNFIFFQIRKRIIRSSVISNLHVDPKMWPIRNSEFSIYLFLALFEKPKFSRKFGVTRKMNYISLFYEENRLFVYKDL